MEKDNDDECVYVMWNELTTLEYQVEAVMEVNDCMYSKKDVCTNCEIYTSFSDYTVQVSTTSHVECAKDCARLTDTANTIHWTQCK